MESRARTIAVGAFVLTALLLLGVGLFFIGREQLLLTKTVEFNAAFANVGGLQTGATVRVGGLQGGEVLDIRVPPGPGQDFLVKFKITEKLHPLVRQNSTAAIQTEGIVGAMFLAVSGGSADSPVAPPEYVLQGREPVSVSDLIEQTSETVSRITAKIDQVQSDLGQMITSVSRSAEITEKTVASISGDIKRSADAAADLFENTNAIVGNVRAGKGTVGKLLNDDTVYAEVRDAVTDLRRVAGSSRQIASQIEEITSSVRPDEVGADIRKAAANFAHISERLNRLLSGFNLDHAGETAENFSQVLAEAREALSDFSANMEALKHNFFLRGFFKKRGFYDLDHVSIADYKQGKFAPDKVRRRFWLNARDIFEAGSAGPPRLSAHGKKLIDNAIGRTYEIVTSNNPVIIEGYASSGEAAEQYRLSRTRAEVAREYLLAKFALDPDYIGVMPMGGVPSEPGAQLWDGIAIVAFSDK